MSTQRLLVRTAVCAAVCAAFAAPAVAHHSYSMFDRDKTVTITGTIRAWEMVNPHSYLWVNVKNGAETQAWGLEGGGIQALQRAHVTKSSVKPGDKVSVDLHPLRDGRTGGQLTKLTMEDGKIIRLGGGGDATARPGAAPAE
jgi:hypothetical protein